MRIDWQRLRRAVGIFWAPVAVWNDVVRPIAVVLGIAGALGWFVLPGALGTAGVAFYLFGLGVFAVYRMLGSMRLRWEDPVSVPNAIVDTTPGTLWRVNLENVSPRSVARETSVRIDNLDPPIVMTFPIALHEQHDNGRPYRRSFDVRHGEPRVFDLIGMDQSSPPIFYIYRSDGSDEQADYEWMLSEADNRAIEAAMWSPNGWMFDVVAVPDPPDEPATVTLCLRYVDNVAELIRADAREN